MHINNVGETNTLFSGKLATNASQTDGNASGGMRRFVILDRVDISKDGQRLLEQSRKNKLFDPDTVKVHVNNYDIFTSGPDEDIDRLFLEESLDYKEQWIALDKSDSLKVEALNNTYLAKIDKRIERIANTLDRFFDKGKGLYDAYSKEPLKDLFDKEKFIASLKHSVLEVRDRILTMDEVNEEGIKKDILGKQVSSSLENLSFSDLKELYTYAKLPARFSDTIDKYNNDAIDKIVNKEKRLNAKLDQLGLPDYVKASVRQVNRRMSEGMLRHLSFKQEQANFYDNRKEYDRLLNHLREMLRRLGVSIEGTEETLGINPDNKLLFRQLERESELMDEYNSVKAQRDQEAEDFQKLNNNKHRIIETDTYQRVKAVYEEKMKVQDE